VQTLKESEVEADMSGSEINDEFPEQFCFQLTAGEYERLRSQIAAIEHSFQKETLTFSKSGTASGLHRMKLRSNLIGAMKCRLLRPPTKELQGMVRC